MARGLSYGTQGAAGVAPHTPLLGTIMASYYGPPRCFGPRGGGLNLPFWPFSPYTTHIKMKCRVGTLCLCSHCPPYISSKDEKGIVQCYISYRPTTLRKSFNVHRRRPKSSIPPMLNQLSQVYLEYSMSKQICSITQIYCHWYIWIVFMVKLNHFIPY